MAIALAIVHVVFESQLALAQAVDSIADMLAGGALVWAVRQSGLPADADHPRGHARAEPIAALVVAVLAGVLAFEVLRGAVTALVTQAEPELDWPIAAVFIAKIVFKSTIVFLAMRVLRHRANPALDALRIDARNDVLVGSVSVIGFLLARFGWAGFDAGLAIAIAIYVAFSGIRLASENVALLMGSAAPQERRDELSKIARTITGVREVESLVATYAGAALDVHVEVAVDRDLPLLEAHEIGHAVEERLMHEADVALAVVHVGPMRRS
jgi:cation diffusion facilitator family transporter